MNPGPGDYIKTTFYEDGESGLILEVLNPNDYWSRALGQYPTHVFRVLKDDGTVTVWDFFELTDEREFEVIQRRNVS